MNILSKQHEMHEIRALFRQKEIKATLARIIVYQVLKQVAQGLTAYEIEKISIEKGQRINLATIYATLNILLQKGLAQRYKVLTAQAVYCLNSAPCALLIICSNCKSLQMCHDDALQMSIQQYCTRTVLTLKEFRLTLNVEYCLHCHNRISLST
ncbi:Fur family transcriptional regulator [Acinetobacter puyangensis]